MALTSPQSKTTAERLAEARTNLAEKVSVAGIKEALQEEVQWIRRIYQISMLVCTCCIIWKTYQIIVDWLDSGNKTEVSDVAGQEYLPVSNVTICAQVYFNETFIRENIRISQKLTEQFVNETGSTIDSLYHQLTIFLSITSRTRQFCPKMLVYFSKVIRENAQIYNYSAFVTAATPRCESMLKRCSFNGIQFDCCDRAVLSVDDDGTCYQLFLNFDSDNAIPSPSTLRQSIAGPRGGLTVEASMSSTTFSWMDDVEDDGYRVYVNAVPYSSVQSPLGAPHGAETFVKVTAAKRLFSTNCVPRGKLTMKMKGEPFVYYDPKGNSCGYEAFMDMIEKHVSCRFPLALYRPNNSIACHPSAVYFVTSAFAASDIKKQFSSFLNTKVAPATKLLQNLQTLENDWRKALSVKASCLTHCVFWSYSSTASFVYLETEKESGVETREMFSKIHVYYADLGYRQYLETKDARGNTYLAFCNFSNVAMLYLGMSVVSFFDLLFYLCRYLYARLQFRNGPETNLKIKRKLIRNIKVYPQVNIETVV